MLRRRWKKPASSVEDAEPVEGPVVLPGSAGDAGLFRSVDGGRGAAEHGRRRADGDSVHRLQQEGERLLHDRRAEVQLHHVSVRLFGAVGHADRAGHVLARAELELLGPFEFWDAHKVEALNNVDLSEFFWIDLLGQALPKAPPVPGALDAAWLDRSGANARDCWSSGPI